MDKSKVIAAYRRGFITVRECGQILGMDDVQLKTLLQLEADQKVLPTARRRVGS
ncbi:hypothetical protein [Paenibacillus sp. GCM10012306]|uniref:hypothetical protein n=1 Tax=Paenibacillus sp. GCM10012306 TaxID=3317342 RepID=UPI00362373A3